MYKAKNRRLIVVLGAPRSGLTAVTKVLEFLDVRFRPEPAPAGPGRLKGSLQDEESEINEGLLSHLGSGADRLAPVWLDVPLDSTTHRLKIRAFQFLSTRLASEGGILGLKDPGTCRLLGFWNKVFAALDGEVHFVLAVRNPASVAASLTAKDAVPAEKAYFLWLQHVLPSVLLTTDAPRLVVDYDQLLGDPRAEIARISAGLGLPFPPGTGALAKDLESTLLESGRRHAHSSQGDLELDGRASSLVGSAYRWLILLARDQESFKSPGTQAAFEEVNQRLSLASPAFDYINSLEDARRHLVRLGVEREAQIGQAKATFSRAVAERDAHIAGLQAALSSTTSALALREDQLSRLSQALIGRNQHIAALHASNSWRLTAPLRSATLVARGAWGAPTSPLPSPADIAELEQWLPPKTPARPEPIPKPVSLPPEPAPISDLDRVPPGFEPGLYLELHPDLTGSHESAATHYLRYGQYEGRGFLLPEIDELVEDGFKSGRDTILVVSHEASRTGAPLLTLSLVQANADRYNVVALLLGEGPLRDAFRKAGAAVVMSPRMKGNPVVTAAVIRRLHEKFDFRFALVNSIESRAVLPALGQHCIPTVSLLHEFAAYTRPATAFRDAFFWSSEIVFSTKVTLDNAFAEQPDLGGGAVHILPQGRCLVPAEGLTEEQLESEQRRIRRLMRPKGANDAAVIVLGAGTVHIRKGVDLFIQSAARAILVAPEVDYRFVWMGAGYDPLWDAAYSVYVADQIRRAGLEGHIVFIDESVAIETAYEEADLFLLSSRLDPLPNVAIESMAFGLPVLCFDKTTGIADFLNGAGLGNYCVAKFLDSADMAEKLSVLARSKTLRDEVGARSREASTAFFNANKYFAGLGAVAEMARDRVRREKEDARVILESGLFRNDFATQPYLGSPTVAQSVRRHVRGWASGIDRRKPFPGFHPGVYQEQHGLAVENGDPLADYLRAGRPDGPWNCPVISNGAEKGRSLPFDRRVVLHLHVHYPELLLDITTRLSRNRVLPDLLVSVTTEPTRTAVVSQLREYGGSVVAVQLVPNRGRDIGPLLTAFGRRILSDYDYVGHIHTKKTTAVKDAAMGATWYRFLLENLLGGESGAMADSILATLNDDPSIGMAFPDDPHVVGWGGNRAIAEELAARLGLGPLPEHWNFPVGTMFWARTEALAPLVGLALDWEDYPEEPLPYDGTLLHAIERLLPLALSPSQLRFATTNVAGCTR